MIKGHLDQQRANLQSTKTNNDKYANNASATTTPAPPTPATDTHNPAPTPANLVELEELDDFHPPAISPPAQRTYHIYADYASTTGKVFTDQTGRFLQPSSHGNSDMLVFYEYDSNYIHVEPMKNKTGSEILAAYTRAHTLFTSRGLKPQLQRLDNEASTALKSYMESQDVDFQLVPPHVHRRNAAERAIRTFKNHFVAGLCSIDRNFPLHLWDRLLPQALLSLNLLRSSCINPNLSAWAKVHGTFDFNRTPLAPPGTRVLIHEPSTVRETWAPHAVEGWYIGPALQHYRCYTIWADATSAERIANTLTWFPSQVEMPTTSSLELATAAAQDLVAALLHPSDASPLPSADLVQRAALQQLADIFATITDANPTRPTPAPTANTDAPPALVPRVEAETPAPTPTPPPPANPPATAQPAPIPRVPISDTVTYHTKTRNPGQRRQQARKAAAQLGLPVSPSPRVPPPAPPPPPAPAANSPNPHVTRSRSGNLPRANCVVATADLSPDPPLLIVDTIPDTTPVTRTMRFADDTVVTHYAYTVIDPATGASLEYPALLRGPDSTKWEHGTSLEIGRLTQGCLPYTTKGSETMFFIRHTEKPADRIATYLRIVAALKLNKAEMYRIRFTVGGDRIVYHGKVSTPTADLTTVKTHLNSVLSTPDAKYMTIDIKDFYLNTPMDQYEYMWIPTKFIPADIMTQYQLADLVHNNMVMVEIRKGMYGLPQAGILANDRLQAHLATHGYVAAKHTPGFFTHVDRPISFTLVVDDFGVKYVGKEHAQHLIGTLQSLYTVTIDWTGTLYCGLTLKWNYKLRTVDISMPGYVSRALHKFLHTPATRAQHSPHAWVPPTYGATTVQYAPDTDDSPLLDAPALKHLQNVIGTFLYYARAVDSTMLVALGSLASAQTNGTEATTVAITQLLNYCASHPNAILRYHSSGMVLHVHSDASYLSEKHARSRAGGYFFLSSPLLDPTCAPAPDSPPPPTNGAIHVHSSIMTAVLSSAAEAEFGALFHNGKDAAMLRTTLEDMGHPQPATPIQTDNACACGISNDTVKQRRSKAMDMRFYWIRDRVKQGHFLVHWRKGSDNLADYFTKHHSPSHHRLMRSRYLLDLHT